MTRSTEECEMSRSCHSATFSNAAWALRAHHARQAADLLAGDRIALVRHGRRSLLLFAEELFGLAHFGALQVANFGGDLVERGGDHGQRREIVRVAIALDDLRGDGRDLQSQARADLLFDVPASRCAKLPTAPEILPTRICSAAAIEARDVALRFGIPVGQLQAEGDGLGVDAVGAADLGVSLNSQARRFEHFAQAARDPAR